MSSIYNWSTTPATNATADALVNWQEGQMPSTVNNSARQMMSRHAEYLLDNGVMTATATDANTYSVTTNSAVGATPVHGQTLTFRGLATNTAGVTLAINGGAAKTVTAMIRDAAAPVSLHPGDICLGSVISVAYDSTAALGVGSWVVTSGLVIPALSYVDVQSLTGAQKIIAQTNIGLAKTAQPSNLIVNSAMSLSQQNGFASSSASLYYPADQWFANNIFSGSGVVSSALVASDTAGGSKNRIRRTVTTAQASLGASDYSLISQRIEGVRISSLLSGTATPMHGVVRFGFKGPAGTYTACLRNGAVTRSYLVPFTITSGQANTDTTQTFSFLADTSGSWPSDNTAAMEIGVCIGAGATFTSASSGSWLPGNFLAHSTASNGIATVSEVYELFDVGLYLDPTSAGIAPAWTPPIYNNDLLECSRYYTAVGMTVTTDALPYSNTAWFPVRMRTAPTLSLSGSVNGAAVAVLTLTQDLGVRQITTASANGDCIVTAIARL